MLKVLVLVLPILFKSIVNNPAGSQLIFRKISKIGSTSGHILRTNCTKFVFFPCEGRSAYIAPIAVFKGPTLNGKEGKGGEEKERKGEGKGDTWTGWEGGRKEGREGPVKV